MSTWNFTVPFSDEEIEEAEEALYGYEEDFRDDLGYEVYGED